MTCQDSFHEVAFNISFWTRNISSARILFWRGVCLWTWISNIICDANDGYICYYKNISLIFLLFFFTDPTSVDDLSFNNYCSCYGLRNGYFYPYPFHYASIYLPMSSLSTVQKEINSKQRKDERSDGLSFKKGLKQTEKQSVINKQAVKQRKEGHKIEFFNYSFLFF